MLRAFWSQGLRYTALCYKQNTEAGGSQVGFHDAYKKTPPLVEFAWNGKTRKPEETDEVGAQVILEVPPSVSSTKDDVFVQRKANIERDLSSDSDTSSAASDQSSGDESTGDESSGDERPAKKKKVPSQENPGDQC